MALLREHSIGSILLNAIADGIEIFEYGASQPSGLLRYGLQDLKTLEKLRQRRSVHTALKRLERRKLIEERIEEGRRSMALTEMGLEYLREIQAIPARQLPAGMFTIVSFDIPERRRNERQGFRRFLKQLGFERKHLSVWSSSYDYHSVLNSWIVRKNLQPWVVVMRAHIES